MVSHGPLPEIIVSSNKSIVELYGRQVLPIEISNITTLKVELIKIPPIFGGEFIELASFTKNDLRSARKPYKNDEMEQDTISNKLSYRELLKNIINAKVEKCSDLETKELLNMPNSTIWDKLLGKFESYKDIFLINAKKKEIMSLPLSLRTRSNEGGFFILKLSNGDERDYKIQEINLLHITDLAITYKFSKNNALFWVTSMSSGLPLQNIDIFVKTINKEYLYIGKTNKDGIILLNQTTDYPALAFSDANVSTSTKSINIKDILSVIACKDYEPKDYLYLPINTNRFRPFDVLQLPPNTYNFDEIKVHIFTERGVYRPSEKVFWKVSARVFEDGQIKAAKNKNLVIEIKDSKQNSVFLQTFTTNDFGTCNGSFIINEFAPLGELSITVYKHKNYDKRQILEKLLEQSKEWSNLIDKSSFRILPNEYYNDESNLELFLCISFQVQQFEPPRHYVEISFNEVETLDNTIVGKNNKLKYLVAKITSNYYGGGKLKLAKCRYIANLVPKTRNYDNYLNFVFGNELKEKQLIESGEGTLDADGKFEIVIPLDARVLAGMYAIEVSATVLDVDSKPATKVDSYIYRPKYEVGIIKIEKPLQQEESQVEVIILDEMLNKQNNGRVFLDILGKKYFYN